MELRSTLGRARGLGSTKLGAGHWWAQRVTAIALVPLTVWFVISAISLLGVDLSGYQAWLGQFGNALLMILFVITLFYHAQLGLQVVIEDYVHHEGTMIISLILMKFAAFALAASCVLAVVLVALDY